MSSAKGKQTRVLIVDDAALVRSVLREGLERDPEISVIGEARDPYEARDLLVQLRPDVITLDIEMPRMDGITFLRKFMAVLPTPTIVVSSLTQQGGKLALEALAAGAIDVLAKPGSGGAQELEVILGELRARVKHAKGARVAPLTAAIDTTPPGHAPRARVQERVIGLGASTGGVAALGRILPTLPEWLPGIVIVQHMPAGFTREFAARLDSQCKLHVVEAKDGERIVSGHVFVAPGGDRHLEVQRFGAGYCIRLRHAPPVNGHVPSVDVFFDSLARHVGKSAAACLMTGMGADGAAGLLRLRSHGGRTFAQNRETSVVWGMPAAAEALGAVQTCLALETIPSALIEWASSTELT
ncbi:MAG: chemotaxis response regulator protein-glutamate methylesterase [Polyangiales bacterium]